MSKMFLNKEITSLGILNDFLNSQFFNETGVRVGRITSSTISAHSCARVEKVYSQVSVIALDSLRNVLDDGDVKRNGDSKDWQNDGLVFFVCNKINQFVCNFLSQDEQETKVFITNDTLNYFTVVTLFVYDLFKINFSKYVYLIEKKKPTYQRKS
jgi:hypothetical protein